MSEREGGDVENLGEVTEKEFVEAFNRLIDGLNETRAVLSRYIAKLEDLSVRLSRLETGFEEE